MRLITAAGLLVLSTGPALGAYLVDLDAGDRMTVDSYWEDGDRMHLMRGGVDLSVARRRVRSIHEVSGAEEAGVKPGLHPTPTGAVRGPEGSGSRKDVEAKEVRVARHVVRVQKEVSIARARGDSPHRLKRLELELRRTHNRWRDVKGELAAE
ncbi:MAG: hypothetical protein E6J60_09490 [Deltaproteobacteria bacterium]|nr:MAG: hypothetical protein E6J60_09490 [Deltaproteobacteria bacterium]